MVKALKYQEAAQLHAISSTTETLPQTGVQGFLRYSTQLFDTGSIGADRSAATMVKTPGEAKRVTVQATGQTRASDPPHPFAV